jgi:hypothetical protein
MIVSYTIIFSPSTEFSENPLDFFGYFRDNQDMAKKPKKKRQHGGFRKGAGRKPAHPEGSTERKSYSIPAVLVARIRRWGQSRGLNESEAVTEAIRRTASR